MYAACLMTRRSETTDYAVHLEQATRGLLALNVVVLEEIEKRVGLPTLRALQSLERLGPCLVTELGADLDLVPSSASRLSDRLAEAGLITRSVPAHNRRATQLELTEAGRSVLDEVVAQRIDRLNGVARELSQREREQLLAGAAAFTAAYTRLAGKTSETDS